LQGIGGFCSFVETKRMRTIKFRGRKSDGTWIYGHYASVFSFGSEYHCIFDTPTSGGLAGFAEYAVNPETIGQFTGIRDENGAESFEGDISLIQGKICVIKFDNYFICGWEFNIHNKMGVYAFKDVVKSVKGINCTDFKVIGNIHSNPELLTEE
jgi:uncharacterized phage protein (TIGR01671 family)